MPEPRKVPPIPAHPDDEPMTCIRVNDDWIKFLIGIIQPAMYHNYWGGTLEENQTARRDARQLMTILADAMECDDMTSQECCHDPAPIERIGANGSDIEISWDGGITWNPSPTDPRRGFPLVPPPVTSGFENKCQAAGGSMEAVKRAIDNIADKDTTGLTLAEIAIAIVIAILTALAAELIIPELTPAIVFMVYTIIRSIISLGMEDWHAQFTQEVWDKVLCIFYCHIGDDGLWSGNEFEAAKADIMANITGGSPLFGVAPNLRDTMNTLGIAGMNLAAYSGVGTAYTCEDCGCDTCTDIGNWTATYGTETDRGDNFVVVTAAARGEGFYAELSAANITQGCLTSMELVSGATPYTICCIHPPNTIEVGNEDCSIVGTQCANFWAAGANATFVMKIIFYGDCT